MTMPAAIYRTAIVAFCLVAQSGPAGAADLSLKAQPLPVQAYILRQAVEAGVADPWAIRLNEASGFEIAGAQGNDLNADGHRDYAVSLCLFADSEPAFRTNGFECAFGNLLLSNQSGGYDFIPISGRIRRSRPGETAILIMQERSFGQCADYFCDVLYRLETDAEADRPRLAEIKRCEPDRCTLP
jgi:hypothetical protein